MVNIDDEASAHGKKMQPQIPDTLPFHAAKNNEEKDVNKVQEKLNTISMEDDGDDSFFRKVLLEAREEVAEDQDGDGLSQSSLPSTQPSQDNVNEERFLEDLNPGNASTQDPTTPGGTKRPRINEEEGSPKLEAKIRKPNDEVKGDETLDQEKVNVDILLR